MSAQISPAVLVNPDVPSQPSPTDSLEIKIAYIGGGSREWAMKLMGDLALSEKLRGRLELYDIDQQGAEANARIGNAIFRHSSARTKFTVSAQSSLERALTGADFVVISIEPGDTTLREVDLEIPARYGVLQSVGDTTGPGGVLRALRAVPTFRDFARAIMEYCPDAWVINYTNPMATCTAALLAEAPGIKTFGCCHEVFGTQKRLASLVHDWLDVPTPDREEVRLSIAGVNHFTIATRADWNGIDLLAMLRERMTEPDFFRDLRGQAEAAKAAEEWFNCEGLVAFDLLRRFGALGAAGDRHLAEFVPWYLIDEPTLHRWGVVLTPYSWRYSRSQAQRRTDRFDELKPSGEEGVLQIEALLGLRPLVTNVNLPNVGQMPDHSRGAIIETYAVFSRDRVTPLAAPSLPAGIDLWVRRAIAEQELTMQAALERSSEAAFQAILSSPLVRLSTDDAWEMFREMVSAIGETLSDLK